MAGAHWPCIQSEKDDGGPVIEVQFILCDSQVFTWPHSSRHARAKSGSYGWPVMALMNVLACSTETQTHGHVLAGKITEFAGLVSSRFQRTSCFNAERKTAWVYRIDLAGKVLVQ